MTTVSTPRVSQARTVVYISKVTGVWGAVRVWGVLVVSRAIVVFRVETDLAESEWITWGTFTAESWRFQCHILTWQTGRQKTQSGAATLLACIDRWTTNKIYLKVHLLVVLRSILTALVFYSMYKGVILASKSTVPCKYPVPDRVSITFPSRATASPSSPPSSRRQSHPWPVSGINGVSTRACHQA